MAEHDEEVRKNQHSKDDNVLPSKETRSPSPVVTFRTAHSIQVPGSISQAAFLGSKQTGTEENQGFWTLSGAYPNTPPTTEIPKPSSPSSPLPGGDVPSSKNPSKDSETLIPNPKLAEPTPRRLTTPIKNTLYHLSKHINPSTPIIVPWDRRSTSSDSLYRFPTPNPNRSPPSTSLSSSFDHMFPGPISPVPPPSSLVDKPTLAPSNFEPGVLRSKLTVSSEEFFISRYSACPLCGRRSPTPEHGSKHVTVSSPVDPSPGASSGKEGPRMRSGGPGRLRRIWRALSGVFVRRRR